MNLTFKCNVSVSKKIRALLGDSNSGVVLNVNSMKNGIGEGTLSFSVSEETIKTPEDFLNKETSIMITPISVEDEVPNIETPATNIFSNKKLDKTGKTKTIIDKIAVTTPPEKNEVAYAIKTKEEVETEAPLSLKKDRNYILTLEELTKEISKAQKKVSDIDLNSAANEREKAILFERKEMEEAIDTKAFVVNEKYASLSVNDLEIQLPLKYPFDLSRISAKRLAKSRELRGLLESGMIRFLDPEEAKQMIKQDDPFKANGLKVYDRKHAEDNLFEDDETQKETVLNIHPDIEEKTDIEQIIESTRVGTPMKEGLTLSGSIKKSKYSISNKIAPTQLNKVPAFKPITKL